MSDLGATLCGECGKPISCEDNVETKSFIFRHEVSGNKEELSIPQPILQLHLVEELKGWLDAIHPERTSK